MITVGANSGAKSQILLHHTLYWPDSDIHHNVAENFALEHMGTSGDGITHPLAGNLCICTADHNLLGLQAGAHTGQWQANLQDWGTLFSNFPISWNSLLMEHGQ